MNANLWTDGTEGDGSAAALARLRATPARPAIRPIPRAAGAISGVMKPMARRFGPSLAELAERWSDIAGPRLASLTRPVRLSKGRDGGVLTLVARGPAAALAQAEAPRILERANLYCGGASIVRLRIQQGPLRDPAGPALPASRPAPRGLSPSETRHLMETTTAARSPALAEALQRLGRAVLSRAP